MCFSKRNDRRLPEKRLIMIENFDGSDLVIRNERPNKLLVTFDEASVALSISRAMLNKLVRTGRLKVTRIGRCVRLSQEELMRLSGGQILGGVK